MAVGSLRCSWRRLLNHVAAGVQVCALESRRHACGIHARLLNTNLPAQQTTSSNPSRPQPLRMQAELRQPAALLSPPTQLPSLLSCRQRTASAAPAAAAAAPALAHCRSFASQAAATAAVPAASAAQSAARPAQQLPRDAAELTGSGSAAGSSKSLGEWRAGLLCHLRTALCTGIRQ